MKNLHKDTKQKLLELSVKVLWGLTGRWEGIKRDWTIGDVVRAKGNFADIHNNASSMSCRLWESMKDGSVRALGAQTPAQAIQMVQAGLKAIYVSGWQVAADANGHMYPDQSLYTHDCVPKLVRGINNALKRQDKIESINGEHSRQWLVPCVADAEAGFGGVLNAFELMKRMIEAGAAGVHFEDQLSSEKKCGHLGGKVLVPTSEFINKLKAARFAADVMGTPTVLIARTDANSAQLLTTNYDKRDRPFVYGDMTEDGFHRVCGGITQAIDRGLSYAPYADVIWCETSKPDLGEAEQFAKAIHDKFPGKMLAYNCSPSFNWRENLTLGEARGFQDRLDEMGYKFQFVTLAGFHSNNHGMFNLARNYKDNGMAAYSKLQGAELDDELFGYGAAKHQKFVGTGYFDEVRNIITGGSSSTSAMVGSTEEEQFHG